MAVLTADEIERIRDEVGDDPVDATLNVYFDRMGTVPGVILVVLRRRLAALLDAPGKLGDSGTSLDYTKNIDVLSALVARYEIEHAGALLALDDDDSTNLGTTALEREASSWR